MSRLLLVLYFYNFLKQLSLMYNVNMVFLILHIIFILYSLYSFLVSPGRRVFDIKDSDLLFKTYMIKPNSWIHFLFLKKNRYKNFLHIKQNAVVILSFWIYFLINSVICSFIVYFELNKISYLALNTIAGILMGIYLSVVVITKCVLSKQSNKLFERQSKMSQKEHDDLEKEILHLVPHFYDSLPKYNK